MDTQTQIERLIELAIVQRTELKELVAQLPQLREHLSTEIEKAFDEAEPQLRAELEEWTTKQTADKTAALGVALEAKIADLAKSLEVSTQARYNAIIAEREENARLAAQAEAKIAEHAASLPSAVKEIVSAELARFPRAGEIDQLRKEFAEPRGLNPRGKWQAGESYNKLDLVTINGDSYTSNTDGNRTRPSRSSADWTLVAARGTGGGGGPTSLTELTTVPSDGDLLIGSGTSWVTSNLTAGAGISITVGPGAITISATDGDITLDDGTAASPSLHFTNDADTGIYRPAANTLGISTSGVQRMYVDQNGITTVGAGGTFDGSVHAANGNANNPSFSFTSDQDTGFYRHGTNELGISIGGTEKAVMTSTTFSITPNVSTSGNLTVSGTVSSGVVTSSFADALSSFTRTGLNGAGAAGVLAIATDGKTINDAISFAIQGKDSANNTQTYGQIKATIVDPTSTSEDSTFTIQTVTAGSLADAAVFSQSVATLSGNLTVSGTTIGLGVTPSAWDGTLVKAVQLADNGASLSSFSTGNTSGKFAILSNNAYYDSGGWKYLQTAGTAQYRVANQEHLWYSAASGTAGNAITFTERMKLDSSGNLTVSGTGTSSIGGEPSAGLATYSGNLRIQSTGNGPATVNGIELQNSQSGSGYGYKIYTNNSNDYIGIAGRFGSATWTEFLAIKQNTGNVLIGTTTDAGYALQVKSASDKNLVLDVASGQRFTSLYFSNNSSGKAGFYWDNTDSVFNMGALAGGSTKILSGSSVVALTLDSSQNAIFANDVRVQAATSALTWFKDANATKAWGIGSNGWAGLSGGDGSMIFGVYTGSGWYKALELTNGTASNATFTGSVTTAAPSGGTAGAWKLGIRVAATTTLDTTQYLQVDIGGTLYKVALVTS